MSEKRRDESGRAFLLAYIDLLKSEMDSLQRQLDRYAEDFQALLAADETPVRFRSSGAKEATGHHSEAQAADVSRMCRQIAELVGKPPAYCTALAHAAASVIAARKESGDKADVMQMSLEISMACGYGRPSVRARPALPLSARIFMLAEDAVPLIASIYEGKMASVTGHTELSEFMQAHGSHLLDPQLVAALMGMPDASKDLKT